MILLTSGLDSSYSFLFDNLWEKAYYWRYITIISIFLMIIYKRKVSFYEKFAKQLENDKKIIRRAIFTYSEIHLKELMKSFINNNGYSSEQQNKLKDFNQYIKETEEKLISENLRRSSGELKVALNNVLETLEQYFVKDGNKDCFILQIDPSIDQVQKAEMQDKISSVLTTFESQYFNFLHEIKKEFI